MFETWTDALQDLSRPHSNPARQIPSGQEEEYGNQLELKALMADGTLRRSFRRLRGPP
jgi:hypothetical protein